MNNLLKRLLDKQPEKTRKALNNHVIALRVYRHNNMPSKRINSKIDDIEYALKAYF